MAEVLVAHQRHRANCLCGWSGLGRSLPEHQADELTKAGYGKPGTIQQMSTMADIVREHWVQSWEHPTYASAVRCMKEGCTWEGRFPGDISEHVAEELANAGYGELAAASDGYHTFTELYEFRKLYNAALFNAWAEQGKHHVHKSWKHADGEDCFGGGWFIVMAELPTGQISNHYEEKDWDLFQIPVRKTANQWDNHTVTDVAKRLTDAIRAGEA